MSESVPVRRMTATVTVTRDIAVVLPIGITDKEAAKILRESALGMFTAGQEAAIRIDEVVKVRMVDPTNEDLFVLNPFGEIKSTGHSDWTTPEKIEKYVVKKGADPLLGG